MSGEPLLIAVLGVGPRTGVTTTALALAQTWPEAALLVEADPAGGQLAELSGADPYLGLASLARSTGPAASATPAQLGQHLQVLPGGVAVLAAPPRPDASREAASAAWAAAMLTAGDPAPATGQDPAWKSLRATVIADCGTPAPGSVVAPILAAAHACLIVLRADLTDPDHARPRIRELTDHAHRRAILLISSRTSAITDRDYATILGLPVLASLPNHPRSVTTLIDGTRPRLRRNRLLPVAGAITAAITTQLRPPPPGTATTATVPADPPARAHLRRPHRGQPAVPTVYRIDAPPTAHPDPDLAYRTEPATEPRVARPAHPAPSDTATGTADRIENGGGTATSQPAGPPRPVRLAHTALAGLPAGGTGPGLQIEVFGPTRILWRDSPDPDTEAVQITRRLEPRSRELLAVLALHPDGVTQTELIEALWGQHPPHRPVKALGNALSRLRTTLVTATGAPVTGLFTDDQPHYRLGSMVVHVDYWEFGVAIAQRRAARSEAEQARACARIARIAAAPLAADLSHLWAEPLREAARRDTLTALSWLTEHPAAHDPRATLGMLETIVKTDPYNEQLWQHILRLQARWGEHETLDSTYSLLERKLAEINTEPGQETRQLYDHLRRTTR